MLFFGCLVNVLPAKIVWLLQPDDFFYSYTQR